MEPPFQTTKMDRFSCCCWVSPAPTTYLSQNQVLNRFSHQFASPNDPSLNLPSINNTISKGKDVHTILWSQFEIFPFCFLPPSWWVPQNDFHPSQRHVELAQRKRLNINHHTTSSSSSLFSNALGSKRAGARRTVPTHNDTSWTPKHLKPHLNHWPSMSGDSFIRN